LLLDLSNGAPSVPLARLPSPATRLAARARAARLQRPENLFGVADDRPVGGGAELGAARRDQRSGQEVADAEVLQPAYAVARERLGEPDQEVEGPVSPTGFAAQPVEPVDVGLDLIQGVEDADPPIPEARRAAQTVLAVAPDPDRHRRAGDRADLERLEIMEA